MCVRDLSAFISVSLCVSVYVEMGLVIRQHRKDTKFNSGWRNWISLTFQLGVVHGKHIDGHKLQHTGTSDRRWAMLQQCLELLKHLLSHCRECLHPTNTGIPLLRHML